MKRRPDWDEYFMEIAEVVAKRSTCLRRQIGAVIVKDKRILATGYNGAPAGLPHCLELGCLRDELGIASGTRHEICRALHSEQNAIVQAALYGVSTRGSTLYCTHQPCSLCAKMLINAGISRVVFEGEYPDGFSLEMLEAVEIQIVRFARRKEAAEVVKE
ncbi:MAG: cytidine/deoxycytidylate deaminase family protein [Armatimonadota bacterium]|nr:cytidine/deoxycytidylate deaminase family protein [Armatimonadota bacterium]